MVTREELQEDLKAITDILFAMNGRFDRLEGIVIDTQNRVTRLEGQFVHFQDQMEDIQDTLKGLERAVDKDGLASINHEKRISTLERQTNIMPRSVKHLRKFAA